MQKFVLLKVDLTREDDDPALGLLKAKYKVDTLPAIRVATPTGVMLGALNELVTPAEFVSRIAPLRD